jgi:hypothetical protein
LIATYNLSLRSICVLETTWDFTSIGVIASVVFFNRIVCVVPRGAGVGTGNNDGVIDGGGDTVVGKGGGVQPSKQI